MLRRYLLLNSRTDPILPDPLQAFKTGNDSNAKALRMLAFFLMLEHPTILTNCEQ